MDDPNQGRSYSANNPPGAFSVPNAGNTAGQPRVSRGPDNRGLGGLASQVSTPMDKYNDGRGGMGMGGGGPGMGMGGGMPRGAPMGARFGDDRRERDSMNPRFIERGGYGDNYGPGGGPMRGGGGGPPGMQMRDGPRGGGSNQRNIDQMDYGQLQDEVERLRTENAMLKRSARDMMNNFNELSNRLFDVDESLKKVANVFPSEDEMESLEWLLKK